MYIVLESILFVLTEGCSWRAIDRPQARWNSVYQYFRRWCQRGTLQTRQRAWLAHRDRRELEIPAPALETNGHRPVVCLRRLLFKTGGKPNIGILRTSCLHRAVNPQHAALSRSRCEYRNY